MLELLDDLEIKCNECSSIIRIGRDDIDFESSFSIQDEDYMDDEVEYCCDGSIECPGYGNIIVITFSGRGYPAGEFFSQNSDIDGGEFINTPHVAEVYRHEDFDPEHALDEYDRIGWLIGDPSRNNERIYDITPREFEEVVERLFQDEGFKTVLTPETGDGGKDIIATKWIMGKPVVFYVECKQYGKRNDVGVDIVRSLYGVQMAGQINKSILVTTGHVTRGTKKFVDERNTLMSVIDADQIFGMLWKSASKDAADQE